MTKLGRNYQDRGEHNKTLASLPENRDCLSVGQLVYYIIDSLGHFIYSLMRDKHRRGKMQRFRLHDSGDRAEFLLGSHCRHLLIALFILPLLFSSSMADDKDKALRRSGQPASPAQSYDVGLGDLYALVVGVSKYRHPKIPQLKVSDRDATDFAGFLQAQDKLFRKIHITLLKNEEATRSEVTKHLYYKIRQAGKDDTVILFFSGHGTDDPNMPGEFFFVTYDADPDYLEASTVNMSGMKFLNRLDSGA